MRGSILRAALTRRVIDQTINDMPVSLQQDRNYALLGGACGTPNVCSKEQLAMYTQQMQTSSKPQDREKWAFVFGWLAADTACDYFWRKASCVFSETNLVVEAAYFVHLCVKQERASELTAESLVRLADAARRHAAVRLHTTTPDDRHLLEWVDRRFRLEQELPGMENSWAQEVERVLHMPLDQREQLTAAAAKLADEAVSFAIQHLSASLQGGVNHV